MKEKLDPNKKYPLKDYCWKCLDEGYATPKTQIVNGFPVCDEHSDIDPETMEQIFIQILGGCG